MERVQTLVVGAGVVGLACARALARSGREVVIAEAAPAIGTGTSSRNSEVVHAGIYYPAGSRKARHCVQGARQLLDFCTERGVAHRVCGKLIVATSEHQRLKLAAVAEHAAGNGVQLRAITAKEVRDMEPEVSCVSALHSPRTAVVDSHGFMEALLTEAEVAGASLALKTRVLPSEGLLPGGGVAVRAESSGEAVTIKALEVVNCAGLAAPRVASSLGAAKVPSAHFCKGSYYSLQPASHRPFSRLIYPIPEENTSGLGIHATVDLAGQVRFGPDVEWLLPGLAGSTSGQDVDEVAYDEKSAPAVYAVDTARTDSFYQEVRRYWPGLPDGALIADYSGIRPKLSAPGQPAADFVISEHRLSNTMPGLLSLFGIESPGLTSALSLADEVLERLGPPPSE